MDEKVKDAAGKARASVAQVGAWGGPPPAPPGGSRPPWTVEKCVFILSRSGEELSLLR